MSYIVKTVDEFFVKLDKMQRDLEKFSKTLDSRSEKVPALLKDFENAVFKLSDADKNFGTNAVEQAAKKSFENLRETVQGWKKKIEAEQKGRKFIQQNEKFLVVMVFGAVKAGKSSLGNFFAGKKFVNAPFDNHYKKIPKPKFEIEEKGRDTGDKEKDSSGNEWFSEGVIDTTGAIQYFTLSGLRWIDSPGTGAVGKEGDTKDMTALVEEYLNYTDMCIFLMNSSEPGVQDDMKYMQKLNKEGQEALIVITKSDTHDEDEDEDGNEIRILIPKSDANRKTQEDDICKRLKQQYPKIDEKKFRALSISTLLANEAIKDEDDEKFKASNLDKLMKILGDKVSDNVIAKKQENPRRLLNNFVDSVVGDLKDFDSDIEDMIAQVEKYKNDMSRMSKQIVMSVSRGVRADVTEKTSEWNRKVKRGENVDNSVINDEISKILQERLSEEINLQMQRVIEDFQNAEMKTVKANISGATLEKKTAQISHTYTESYTVTRPPEGLWENIRSFFGKEYYRREQSTHTKYQTVDLGTNLDEFLDNLMPQAEQYAKNQADEYLTNLRESYFIKRENFAKKMREEIKKLRDELVALKF